MNPGHVIEPLNNWTYDIINDIVMLCEHFEQP